ncbi:VCBS repeat-containing protein [uncultured Croceitalea sp.]|uniref:VCBS repeat-containing protein n=1 Tax=uncultured Croceitalea sp. TaxID=1798908 RepID=UPI0033060C6D
MESTTNEKKSVPYQKLFEKIDSKNSGLVFNNKITEDVTTQENLFNYDYFYNGAGVGIEDLNNDNLPDVFFCGNQVPNKLFINKGGLRFDDVSSKSNINKGKHWSNGITFVDINNDGWNDIYVSQGGPRERSKRKNQLLINQHDGTFSDKAEEYGLADMGISTQSAFFDYDNDGDLDCLVMNENEFYGVDPINLYRMAKINRESKYFNSSHIYENRDGTFIDVTTKAGIERPIFGLGLTVSDINQDGWLDFYIASDYYIPDALFINNGDGTFSDKIKEYTNHISFYGMGMDIADINNDNLQDIFVLDMAANDHVRSKTLMASMNTSRFDYLVNKADFHHQYMFNTVQLNRGDNKFSDIAQATKMANTDWSWSVLLSDLDNDEDKDVFITNGYRRYALDNDLQQQVLDAKRKYKGNVPMAVKKSLYESIPSEKLPNILFENQGSLAFKYNAADWGLADFSFSNGCSLADLDNDGDLDVVVNNMDENCFLYKNTAVDHKKGNFLKVKTVGKISEDFPKISVFYNGKQQFIETRRVRGYRSAQPNIAHFGLGSNASIDSLKVVWPNGLEYNKTDVSINTTVIIKEEDAKVSEKSNQNKEVLFKSQNVGEIGISYSHTENKYDDFEKEILLPYKQSTFGPYLSKGDFNGDGTDDFYVGGATGQSGVLYFQNSKGTFFKENQPAFESDKLYEDMQSAPLDWDNDGDLDLFVVSGGNEFKQSSSYYSDRLYINNGKGTFKKLQIDVLTKNTQSGKAVTTLDFDKDGDIDILVGNRVVPQKYPLPAPSSFYKNQNGVLVNVTDQVAPDLKEFGIINHVISTDFDDDGWMDFIAVGEWTGIGLFKNNKGSFQNINKDGRLLDLKGWWFSVSETDVNNDGLPDFVLGNVGTNLKFKASKKKPFKVFANDFDENGTPDIVLSKEYQGQLVPVRGRECSSQQMPFIKQKFKTYSEFANASLVDVYGEKLESAYEAEANEFKSVLLINLGNGQFQYSYLPPEAQFSPIMKTIFLDVNEDGYQDAVLAGNIYETEVETTRLDAITGQVLISNGKDGYYAMPMAKSGLRLNGNIKDAMLLRVQNQQLLLVTENNGPLHTHFLKY